MSRRYDENVDGAGIFFGCGHSYVMGTERFATLDPGFIDRLLCPICYHHECLICGAFYSGWLDTCGICLQFCTFESVADEAVTEGVNELHFGHGIVVVPCVGDEPFKVFGWPKDFHLGVGRATFTEEIDDHCISHVGEPIQLHLSNTLSVDAQGQRLDGVDQLLINIAIDDDPGNL
ncbi:hypothetical protein F5Y04DRAFT_291531 [Hypomontagnella monticulosa]|nr:hypothetical protein F5Y04DRAFT_291531 [Hypomontagnella monticulosa]